MGVGALAAGLLATSVAVVLLASDLSLPSAEEISQACSTWLSSGGPGTVLGLLIIGLATGVLLMLVRSLWRQVRAGRAYVRQLPLGEEIWIDGLPCARIEVDEPVALCAGYVRPRVHVSRGLIEELSAAELRAIVAHERHHLRRRDPLRRLLARALADGFFFIPMLRRSSERYVALGELAADQAAVATLNHRGPLAAALLKFSEHELPPSPVAGIDPERVDQLLGDPRVGRWRLPTTVAGWSIVALLSLAGVAVAATVVQPGLGPPLLVAAGCMLLMVGGPVVLAATAVAVSKRALQARRS
jgi:Zn-dependent protease with chaperone function